MVKDPSQTAAQKIRSVLLELSAQHGLDTEACTELCSHLEEKLADYLSGAVKITEDDAIILARSHFGDAQRVASAIANEGRQGTFAMRWLRWPASPQLTFAMAVAMLGAIFGLVVPLIAYLSGNFQMTFKAQWPIIPMFIIKTSPWTPLLLATLGVMALVAKERFCKAGAALRINIATIVGTTFLGGFTCFILWLPIIQVMHSLSR